VPKGAILLYVFICFNKPNFIPSSLLSSEWQQHKENTELGNLGILAGEDSYQRNIFMSYVLST